VIFQQESSTASTANVMATAKSFRGAGHCQNARMVITCEWTKQRIGRAPTGHGVCQMSSSHNRGAEASSPSETASRTRELV
jgi:hypothetical protein